MRELLEAGVRVVVVDNLDNSSAVALERVARARARRGDAAAFHEVDIRDAGALDARVRARRRSTRSSTSPGSRRWASRSPSRCATTRTTWPARVQLLQAMERHDVRDLVFSSSCTVYGDPERCRSTEDTPARRHQPVRPHQAASSRTCCATSPPPATGWRIVLLRYFNPVGAHPSGRIGEDPRRHPEQPDAVHHAGGRRPPRPRHGVRRRLPDARRHRRARLHPRRRPRRGPPRRARARSTASKARGPSTSAPAPGTRCSRSSRAAVGGGRARHPLRDRPAARRRHRRGVGRPGARRRRCSAGARPRDLDDMCADHWRWQSTNPDGYRAT